MGALDGPAWGNGGRDLSIPLSCRHRRVYLRALTRTMAPAKSSQVFIAKFRERKIVSRHFRLRGWDGNGLLGLRPWRRHFAVGLLRRKDLEEWGSNVFLVDFRIFGIFVLGGCGIGTCLCIFGV